MEELPEKNTPESRSEDRDPTAEDAPAAADQPSPSEPTQQSESAQVTGQSGPEESSAADDQPSESTTSEPEAERDQQPATATEGKMLGNEEPLTPEAPPEPQPVPSAQPEHVESEVALQQEGTPAENPEVAAQPEAPAVEAAAAPEAEAPQGEAAAEEAQAPVGDVELTPSGAVRVPGAEGESTVEAAQEERPKKGAPRAEKPTGPRMADLREGQVVEGTVSRIEKYGAFVNLGLVERRDGLIHISELAPGRVRRVEDVVQVGGTVRARIVSVDLGKGRIALSLNDVDSGSAKEASVGPAEPAITSMAAAFQQAQSRQREEQRQAAESRDTGSKKKREQEELMRRLRSGNQ